MLAVQSPGVDEYIKKKSVTEEPGLRLFSALSQSHVGKGVWVSDWLREGQGEGEDSPRHKPLGVWFDSIGV